MARWGEINCPRCEELEAKLEREARISSAGYNLCYAVQNSDRFLIEKKTELSQGVCSFAEGK
jgi:hypothetical protein